MQIEPVRLQRSRHKKLVSPNGLPIVYCGRPSKWGNPYIVDGSTKRGWYVLSHGFLVWGPYWEKSSAINRVIDAFNERILPKLKEKYDLQKELGEKNLACWCPVDQPCHCDILLQEANS